MRKHSNFERGSWDDNKVALLKKLYHDGLSCSLIAARIGGISRNSVIGKIHRLDLPLRGHDANRAHRTPRKPTVRKPARPGRAFGWLGQRPAKPSSTLPVEPLPHPHETDIPRVSFVDLGDAQCKFICTDEPKGPTEKQFCGQPRHPGLPYCADHARRCYGPPRPKSWLPLAPSTPTIVFELEKEDA